MSRAHLVNRVEKPVAIFPIALGQYLGKNAASRLHKICIGWVLNA